MQGNCIGTASDGQAPLHNAYGIEINGNGSFTEHDILIGGSEPGAGNLISGNTAYGVQVSGAGATEIRIEGNKIGTDC